MIFIQRYFALMLFLFCAIPFLGSAQEKPYTDLTHSSKVFGREKYYRLYLPKGYEQSKERYPVIYFFHGWGGRHFKDDSANLEYELIKDLVDKFNLILVMWDGNIEESEPRPYNIGNHENVKYEIQMKDYFLELISHVDSTYKTFTDRTHRGIIGFSMGGIMSYFIAGKYPDKVCAAVGMTGSPEFFIGYPKNHTLYPLRYTFKNLEGVKVRMHNSTHDELVYLNEEVDKGARWEGGVSFDYWQFIGGHMVDLPGKTEVFEKAMKFVVDAFKYPLSQPDRWWHYDLYPDFDVWGYHVKSNKQEPGFIYLKNVSKNGFGVHSRKWLPDGPPIPNSISDVTTAPIYQPNSNYNFIQYSFSDEKVSTSTVRSDKDGRMAIHAEGENEFGIFKEGDEPDLVVVNYNLGNHHKYLRPGKENNMTLTLLNRGGNVTRTNKISVELSTSDSAVVIVPASTHVSLSGKNRVITIPPFKITTTKRPPQHSEPAWIKFNLNMKTDDRSLNDEFVVPVFFDVLKLDSIRIDDDILVKDEKYGKGNGDGKVSAGESIMIYSGNHRLRLFTDDPYVEINKERLVDEVIPAKWPDGFSLSSVIKISDTCPKGHVIELLASYDSKTFMPIERKVTWGKVLIKTE